MKHTSESHDWCCCRRDFFRTLGTAAGTAGLLSAATSKSYATEEARTRISGPATVRGAFVYPPSETLRQAGYWSWPGSSFDRMNKQ